MDDNGLPNAEKIIERFGGIRPMANKLDVPVTTVQGWKKRNVIPPARRDDVLKAAQENNIDISDLAGEAEQSSGPAQTPENQTPEEKTAGDKEQADPAKNDPAKKEPEVPEVKVQARDDVAAPTRQKTEDSSGPSRPAREEPITHVPGVKTPHQQELTKWLAGTVVVLALVVLTGVLLMAPEMSGDKQRPVQNQKVAALENNVREMDRDLEQVREETGFLSSIVPKDLQGQLKNLKNDAVTIKSKVSRLSDQAKDLQHKVLSSDAGTLEERIAALEKQVRRFAKETGSQDLLNLTARIRGFQQSMRGKETLNAAMSQISNVLGQARDETGQLSEQKFEQALTAARKENPALAQTLQGVSDNDMKAAVMLIGLSQFRQSLSRDNVAFEQDLKILENLAAKDDPELKQAINKLAPHAQRGVLSPSGLSQEFKQMAGDVVVASLKGEDVSISEKARARLNEIMQVQKNGRSLTGTQTQVAVSKAKHQLDQGDIEGAIKTLEQLDGPARKQAQPFISKAQATMLAQKVKALLTRDVLTQVTPGASGMDKITADSQNFMQGLKSMLPGQQGMVYDPESGFRMVVPSPELPEGAQGLEQLKGLQDLQNTQ